ncbi:AAA family ATPase [Crocosphaera sp. XPORK-15E]|uniref:AAA family ATPase n=1 Tax=Crocosphaera sp. XPORK-15E TaxID=3110247 RepID=UPI002B1FB54A|nr:AAA family ATPase [Crocosphaera sp. XPORK-15E]MEA5537161.1 AAA family ATPase [Crocosphaera sp. XPORK-15E]
MKIKSIRVCNFKTFKDCTIHFNDFNVVIGSNASGKSNFVEIFKFLKDIEKYGLENAISLQGGVEYFRNNQIGTSQNFSLEIVFSYKNCLLKPFNTESDLFFHIKELNYKFNVQFDDIDKNKYHIFKDELIYKCDLLKIIENREKDFLGTAEILSSLGENKLKFDFNLNLFDESANVEILDDDGLNKYLETIKKSVERSQLEPNFLLLQTPFFVFGFPIIYHQRFDKIGIFDFEPKLPKKAAPITGKIDLEEDGSNLAIVLNKILRDPEKNRKLSNFVRDLLPFIDKLEVEKFADKSLMFKLKETYAKNNEYFPAAFISDGTINIIALIVALYFSNTSFTIIEEPERNIHPHLISKVVEMMKDASKNKQTLITTHNPEIVKYANLEDILLITRDEEGFSQITRPSDSEQVKIFLENEIRVEELYIQNLLELGK